MIPVIAETVSGVVGTVVTAFVGFSRWISRATAAVVKFAAKGKSLFDRVLEGGPLATDALDLDDWAKANDQFEMTVIPQVRSRRLRRLCCELLALIREIVSHLIPPWRVLGSGRRRLESRQMAAAHRGVMVCHEIVDVAASLNALTFRFA